MIETKKSFCRFCHVHCGIEVDVEDNRVVAVRGDADNAVSEGYTCIKGRAEIERIYHTDRLLSSKKKVEGQVIDIPTEDALDEIAEKLKKIVDQYGPRSVAIYAGCGGHRTSAGGIWFLTKFLEALKSPNFYTCFTIDSPSLLVSYTRLFGAPALINVFDIVNADVAMFVGSNPVVSHMQTMPQSNPGKRLNDSLKRGMKLIVIDPMGCEVAKKADIHLQVKPGEDATLLAGLIKIIIEQKLYDKEYVENYVSGVDALYEVVKDFDLDYVSRRTTVPAELITKAAEMFAAAERGAATSGTGLHMARHQNLSTQLVMVLNALCGRYDRQGGLCRNEGPLSFELPEDMGAVPLPLYTGVDSRIRGIKGTMSWLGFCPEMPTSCLTDEILTPGDGQIRALIVVGGNPALVCADEEATVRALKDLDLLVVNDLYMSATAKFADYTLAVKHPFERTDITKMMDGNYPIPFGQYSPPLVDGPDGMMEDWETIWGLAKRLDLDMAIPGLSMDRTPTSDEIINSLHFPMARIPFEEFKKDPGGTVWGEPGLKFGGVIPNMIGHEDKRIAIGHPEVLDELREVFAESVIETGGYEPDENRAYRLITYRMKEAYCSQGQNLPSLRERRSYNPLLMNPQAMQTLGVKDGDVVVVDSGFGKVEAIAEGTDDLMPGTVALAFGWGDPSDDRHVREKGSNVQRLIPDDYRYDTVTGLPLLSAIPVNISTST